jgi:hypothetical protein
MPSLLTLKVRRGSGYVVSGALRVSTRITILIIMFALATYTALNIQTHIGDSPTFNKTLGLDSPLIIGGYGLYVNLVAIITDAVLVTIAYLVLAKDRPRTGFAKYFLGIITGYALMAAALYLAITTKPAHACTSMPMSLDGIATFTVSIVIGSVTPLVYAHERDWKIDGDWEPLLFTLYASIIVGSLIIDVVTALVISSISRLAPAYMGSVIIGAYGPIDGLVTAPLLGLLAGYTVVSTITNKQ